MRIIVPNFSKPQRKKYYFMTRVPNEDSDQLVHLHGLINGIAGLSVDSYAVNVS